MRRLLPLLAVLLLLALALAPLVAQDSTATAPLGSAGTQLLTLLGAGLGAGIVAVTELGKKLVSRLDGTTAQWDGWITALYKPVQPWIAMGLAIVVVKLGLFGVTGDQIAAAPTGTLLALGVRELGVKLLRLLHAH